MQLTTLLTLALTALATANPLVARAPICPSGDTLSCCQLDVDGVADLTCDPVSGSPKTKAAFKASCAKSGTTAKCCTLVVDGTGVVCNSP